MGFRCDKCHAHTQSSSRLVTAKTRSVQYPFRKQVNRPIKYTENGKPKVRFPDDPGGYGHETVVELKLCEGCHAKMAKLTQVEAIAV